jgi:hypothetical protein
MSPNWCYLLSFITIINLLSILGSYVMGY